jgi:hypothetical protein
MGKLLRACAARNDDVNSVEVGGGGGAFAKVWVPLLAGFQQARPCVSLTGARRINKFFEVERDAAPQTSDAANGLCLGFVLLAPLRESDSVSVSGCIGERVRHSMAWHVGSRLLEAPLSIGCGQVAFAVAAAGIRCFLTRPGVPCPSLT